MTQLACVNPPNILVQPLFPPLAVALGIDYHREASCPQLRNERERTTQKDRRREKAAPSFNVKFTTPRRYAHVNSRSSPRVSQSATPPNDGQGDDRMGRKRERDWGSGSQTSIGPHSRAVGAQFRNVARARETSQETPLVFPAGETTDTDALAHAHARAHPGGLLAAPILAKGGQSSWKGTRRRAMERDEREGAPLDVCYLPVLRAAEAPTGQSVYRQRSCP